VKCRSVYVGIGLGSRVIRPRKSHRLIYSTKPSLILTAAHPHEYVQAYAQQTYCTCIGVRTHAASADVDVRHTKAAKTTEVCAADAFIDRRCVMLPLGRHNCYQVRPPCLSESRKSRVCSYAHVYASIHFLLASKKYMIKKRK